jgi:hypothetical protein
MPWLFRKVKKPDLVAVCVVLTMHCVGLRCPSIKHPEKRISGIMLLLTAFIVARKWWIPVATTEFIGRNSNGLSAQA